MNVLIFPSWYPASKEDQRGSFFREQAIAIAKQDNDVFVLNGTLTSRKNIFRTNCTQVTFQEDDGIHVLRQQIPSFGFERSERLCDLVSTMRYNKLYLTFRERYPNTRVDIIHAHSCYPAGQSACLIGKKNNIPVVITEHRSNYLQTTIKREHIPILKQCIHECASFICVSEALKHNILVNINASEEDERKMVVIPNLVSSHFVKNTMHNTSREPFVFVSIGSLIPLKRHMQLVRCFINSFKGNRNVRLLIVGDGPEYNRLRATIEDYHMEEQIFLLGKLAREDVAKVLQKADAFALTSAIETFGVVYIEALACGVPVIGTKNGGANDIVNQDNGILIDVDNDEQLIHALVMMFNERQRFDSDYIAAEANRLYSEKSVVSRIMEIYREEVERYHEY